MVLIEYDIDILLWVLERTVMTGLVTWDKVKITPERIGKLLGFT